MSLKPKMPCPFCGSDDLMVNEEYAAEWVMCQTCYCRGPDTRPAEGLAIKTWDTRKPPAVDASAAICEIDARAELDRVSTAIGSDRFLDPPDGGSVSLSEQVQRMRLALEQAESEVARLRALLRGLKSDRRTIDKYLPAQTHVEVIFRAHMDAIDAALEAKP